MKKIIAVVTSLMALEMTALPSYGFEDRSLLVLGDSIASGYGLDGYVSGTNSSAKDSFANLLSAEYSSYENEAVDGRTSAELLEALGKIDLKNADDIVISIGGNDFLSSLTSSVQLTLMSDPDIMAAFKEGDFDESIFEEKLTPETIQSAFDAALNAVDIDKSVQNLSDTVAYIENENPDSEIYILTVYNPFAGNDEYSAYSDGVKEIAEKYNDGVMNLSESYGNVHYVDVYSAFDGHEKEYTNISSMDIHPNADGHRVIYELLKGKIDENTENTTTETAQEADTEVNVAFEENAEETINSPVSDNSSASVPTGNAGKEALSAVMALSLLGICVTFKKK